MNKGNETPKRHEKYKYASNTWDLNFIKRKKMLVGIILQRDCKTIIVGRGSFHLLLGSTK